MQNAMAEERAKNARAVFLIFLALFSVIYIKQVSQAVFRALEICVRIVIPSLFPFAVLADLLVYAVDFTNAKKRDCVFLRRLLGIPVIGLLPFFLGALCGFPIGIKTAAELYRRNLLTQKEFSQTVCFVNNTSPAFVIGSVGIGMLSSAKVGVLLYVIQIVSALLCGFLFARIRHVPPMCGITMTESVADGSLVAAIRRSALSCLWITGSICTFSALLSLIAILIKNTTVCLFISSFLEVGTACAAGSAFFTTRPPIALLVLCIAICFGGASVHLQSAAFLPESKPLFRYYLGAKLCQAAISVVLLLLVFPVLT